MVFSLCLVDLCENGETSKLLQGTAIRKVGMGFPTTPKSAPQLDPFPHLGGRKHEINAKNGFNHFQMIKLLGEVLPINNFQMQSCLRICLEDISEKIFEIGA